MQTHVHVNVSAKVNNFYKSYLISDDIHGKASFAQATHCSVTFKLL